MTSAVKSLTPLLIAISAALTSCASLEQQAEAATEPTESTTTPTVPKQALSGQDMFQLLLAEIATNRRELGAATSLYSELARQHNDVAIIERAVGLNQMIGQNEALIELAGKWQTLRPDEPRAYAAQTIGYLSAGDLANFDRSITTWLQKDANADISILLPTIEKLDPTQLPVLKTRLQALSAEYPKSASLLYTSARLNYALNDVQEALALTDRSLKLEQNLQVSLFKFQVLTADGQTDAAGDLIRKLYEDNPTNRQVAIQLTRFIYRYEPDNLADLEKLHNRFGTDPTIARTYARAAFDQQNYDAAEAVFQHLLTQGFSDEGHYFLGRIDLELERIDSAVNHFEAVVAPPYVTSALAEWASLARIEDEARLLQALETARTNHPQQASTFWRLQSSFFQLTSQVDKAWDTLDSAIIRYPSDTPLLYDQAMLAASLERYSVLESNLLGILELDPDNINALNALGYTWADLNKNLDQAEEFIDRALMAEPDNPAFQDSKGWLLYRQGNLDEALTWLMRAFDQMKNDEVAAHIAEVLWYLNRPDEANNFLDEIIRINPESKYIGLLNELFAQ
jgi:tetratricopeptide (TPR) repeat protein